MSAQGEKTDHAVNLVSPQMSPYDNLLLCQPVSSPLPLRYSPRGVVGAAWGVLMPWGED